MIWRRQRGQPGGFGIPLVPADAGADPAEPGVEAAKAQIARREIKLLVVQRIVGNVHLAIHARGAAVGVEDHGRVVIQARRRAARRASRRSPRRARRAARASASLVGPGIGSASSNRPWSSVWQGYCPANSSCRQTMLAPAGGRFGDARQGLVDVLGFRRVPRHLHQRHHHRRRRRGDGSREALLIGHRAFQIAGDL